MFFQILNFITFLPTFILTQNSSCITAELALGTALNTCNSTVLNTNLTLTEANCICQPNVLQAYDNYGTDCAALLNSLGISQNFTLTIQQLNACCAVGGACLTTTTTIATTVPTTVPTIAPTTVSTTTTTTPIIAPTISPTTTTVPVSSSSDVGLRLAVINLLFGLLL